MGCIEGGGAGVGGDRARHAKFAAGYWGALLIFRAYSVLRDDVGVGQD